MKKTFKAKLLSEGPKGAWTFMKLPFNVEKEWGSRARVSVKGTINGAPFASSVFPDGEGSHVMMVNKVMQAGGKVAPGQTATFVLEPDTAPRKVTVPAYLKRALSTNPKAKSAFAGLAPSHQKRYVEWLESAKRRETRDARTTKAVEMIAGGKKIM
jgi:Domain of unknown function (DUF1905)/Bacteriocin-protection, YdeI or OmpD-Associated